MDLSKFHSLDVVMICGLYGAGKSRFAKENFKGSGRLRINRSEIRKLIYEMMHFGDSWSSERFNEEDDILVKHVERKMIEHFVHHKRKILIDNTFTTKKSRNRIVKIVQNLNKSIGIIFLNPPVEKSLERNSRNIISVSENVILNLKMKMELPSRDEGFDLTAIIEDY